MVRVVTLAFWAVKLLCLPGPVISLPTRGQDWISVGSVGIIATFLKIACTGLTAARVASVDNAASTGEAGRLVSACHTPSLSLRSLGEGNPYVWK